MAKIPEGARVSYVGWSGTPDEVGLEIGDQGRVVSSSASAAHVRWLGGVKKGAFSMVRPDDLVVMEKHDPIASLAIGKASFSKIVSTAGVDGVMATLESKGYLGAIPQIAQEVSDLIAARVAAIPGVSAACDQLTPEQGDELISLAKAAVLQEL